MISRFSVKKPYTVVVAVVLVMILGVVSFTKMNTDLLPSMDMPYAVVMTTYAGASPETVEQTVTRPIEQSMATVSNISEVSSVSSANVSVVVLEFTDDANMDSVSLEIREKLDQIKGYWDDKVGNPMIMKLNPDMLPVFVAAVDMDGLSAAKTTDYVKQNILQEMESIAGVARVTASGGVTEQITVLLEQDKINETNQKIQDAIHGTFQEQEEKLSKAEDELHAGRNAIESGKNQLLQGQEGAASQIGEGSAKLNQAKEEMQAGLLEINSKLQELEIKEAELVKQKELLLASRTPIEKMLNELVDAKNQYQQLVTTKQELEKMIASYDNMINQGLEGEDLENIKAQREEAVTQLEMVNASLAAIDISIVEKGIQEANDGLAKIAEATSQLETGLLAIESGKNQLNQGKAQIEAGKNQLSMAQIQLETQKILATVKMSQAAAQVEIGTSKMEEAQQQLDAGKEQLANTKEQVLEKTDLNGILTKDMIKGILTAENFAMPAGYIKEENKEYLVRVGDTLEDVDSLKELVILDLGIEGLAPIKLQDVADVQVTDNSEDVYAVINGNPGVIMTMEKQTGYSTSKVTDFILDRMRDLEKENEGLHFTTLMDQGIYIDMVIDSVMQNMIFGGVLAIFILFVFLRNIRPTFIVACSIPISVITAIVLMYFSNVTLNIISLSGLALGVGMLVDNSIVVIENIYRMRNEGMPAKEAAIQGAKQVAGAICSSTLTTVCVFAPIVFTEGITKQLFVDMGLTIAYSLVASLLVSLTLVPMMSAGLLKKSKETSSIFLDKIQNLYERVIVKALDHKGWVILGATVFFVVSMLLSVSRGTEFFPSMDSTQITMTLTTKKGTPLKQTAEKANEIIDLIADMEDIQSVGAMASASSMMSGGGTQSNSVTMYLVLKEDKKLNNNQLEKEIKNRVKHVKDCELTISTAAMDMSALGGSGISIQITGKELEELQSIAKELAEQIRSVDGIVEVSDGLEESSDQYEVIVDKAKAMEHNLTVAQVFQAINKELSESSLATTIETATKDYQVYVNSDRKENMTRESVGNLQIEYTDVEGNKKKVAVKELAEFKNSLTPQSISRKDQTRYMAVSAQIDKDHNIGLVSKNVEKMLANYKLPEGYKTQMAGEDEMIKESMNQLLLMLSLAIVFMYLIMVAQFQSLLSPFIIMFTIPLAFTGGFIGLWITGKAVSIIAMIGFIMLSGIIVNNGIVLVDYMNQMREEGLTKREAIKKAGQDRLRPIIMTALTTILGLTTMAFGFGMGGEMIQPMAIVTIGGLVYGTLLTLFVVPCIYDLFHKK